MVYKFFTLLVTQMADQSQISTGLSVHICCGLHKVLTLPETVWLATNNSVMFLKRQGGKVLAHLIIECCKKIMIEKNCVPENGFIVSDLNFGMKNNLFFKPLYFMYLLDMSRV